MSKYIHTLFVGISLLLFGTSVSFGDDASYKKKLPFGPPEANCWQIWDYPNKIWYIDCGDLPEIEIVAQSPPTSEDIYHNVGEPWWHVDLFGKPYRWDFSTYLWEEIPASAMPLAVYLDLVHGQSTTIDCAPRGTSANTRKRDLIVSTKPIFNDLLITSITKTRESTPHYGHHHTPDNNAVLCRGSTNFDDGSTNDNGVFQFFYRGPEAAGRTVVNVNWRDPRDDETGSVSMTFENRHDGLVEITGVTGMFLTGADTYHRAEDNHWVTATTKSRIETLASLYYAEFNENLVVNDGSLRYGGLYDYDETWAPPHIEHREGENMDIYPTQPDSTNSPKWLFLMREIREFGSSFADKRNTVRPHLHFRE